MNSNLKDGTKTGTKAVVLLSGGLDSTTCLAIARSEGFLCYCLTFNYGQPHLAAEVDKALQMEPTTHIVHLEIPNSSFNKRLNEALPMTWVPGRNMIFLALAASFAVGVGAHTIFIGANSVDYSGYPDCRVNFIAAAQHTIRLAMADDEFEVRAPLQFLGKGQIIKRGIELGVDYSKTHSCYFPVNCVPCGECDSCKIRAKGFEKAGIPDPALQEVT